jgi:hypothetical protein
MKGLVKKVVTSCVDNDEARLDHTFMVNSKFKMRLKVVNCAKTSVHVAFHHVPCDPVPRPTRQLVLCAKYIGEGLP